MRGRIRTLLKVMTSAALTLTCAALCAAQTPVEQSRAAVLKSASLTADELSAVERGETVVKLLPAPDKREVAFCGVTLLRGEPAALLAAFEGSLTRSNN